MKTFEQLRALVARHTSVGSPPLYRDLYGMSARQTALTLESPAAWQSLPFLTKAHLLTISIENRTFSSFEDIDAYYHTSGTSGKKPLFVPKVLIPRMDFREKLFTFTRPALSSIGYQHRVEAFMQSLGLPPRVVAIDPQRIAISVHLAEVMGIESIFTSTFLIELIGKAMQPDAAAAVRYIELTSEVCSQTLYAFIRTKFPNAMVVLSYGLNEIEDPCIGTVCEASTGDILDHTFHERGEDEHHLEIIDPETEKPLPYVEGTEGELIVTSEAPGAAFPLLRYRTGDIVRITETACARHGKWRFTVLGRAALDFVRVTGGTLRADEIARAITTIGKPFTDEFELHLDTHGPRLKVTLYVRLSGECDSSSLAALMHELRVGPHKTFADAVTEGVFLPIECQPLSPRETPKKRPRLVRI